MNEDHDAPQNITEELPPFGKSWKYWYTAVLLWLVVLMGLFYLFTKAYQ